MKVCLPEKVKKILSVFHENGFSAYIVGGCVRDFYLNTVPSDWDICTNALPDDTKKLFKKTFDTGIQHGTVTVLFDDAPFEVTTFRHDGDYVDNRHPKNVTFSSSVKEDLARRDFTMNAMAYNEKEGLIDPFGGMEDIEKKIIRCVGEPDVRFKEDALRMLRAVRFSAQKGFDIENNTLSSIKKNASLVKNLSVERILSEITKILLSDNIENLRLLYDIGMLKFIMPELCLCFDTKQNIKWHIYDVGMHSLKAVSFLEKKAYLRYAALMHDWGKPACRGKNEDGTDHFRNHAEKSVLIANNFMDHFKFSNKDKDKILRLIKFHDREILPEKKYVKRAINAVGEDIFLDLINLKRADCKAQNFELTAPRLVTIDTLEKIYLDIKENHESFSIKNLNINGNDLINLGFSGKKIGIILNELLDFVIDNPDSNKKEILISLAKRHK